jgi:hypothetical protein
MKDNIFHKNKVKDVKLENARLKNKHHIEGQ